MTLPDPDKLGAIVRDGARRILLPVFGKTSIEYKADGSIVTQADMAMQQYLEEALLEHWGDFTVLGEEMAPEKQQAAMSNKAGYWCVDPLDGTNNFAVGMPFFAVSIALIIGGSQRLGLIYDPVRDECYTAIESEGAWLNGNRLPGAAHQIEVRKTIAEIDMKRLPRDLVVRLLTEEPFSSQRNLGSAALDWCWLAAGRFNVYLHGGQKLWDYSAGNLIVHEAGGLSTSLDGESVFRNRLETRSALASLDSELFDYWLGWIGVPAVQNGRI